MRTTWTLALVPALLACGCAAQRPTQQRDLANSELSSCAVGSQGAGKALQGTAALYLYVDTDGAVPAAWAHHQQGLDAQGFLKCVATAALGSKLEPARIDHLRALKVNCEGQACGFSPMALPEAAPLDFPLARDTLSLADWASDADRGYAYQATHQYTEAIAAFSRALLANADDARAMRGMAVAEVESGGDRRAARNSAERALARAKGAATFEAVARVALGTGDDAGAVQALQEALKAEDRADRAFELAALRAAVKPAADRIEAARLKEEEGKRKAAAEEAAKADPTGCLRLAGGDRAVCHVKRCYAEGAKAFAAEMSRKGAEYSAADPVAAEQADGTVLVTIPLRAAAPKKGKKAKTPEPKDATWAVSFAEGLSVKPAPGNIVAAAVSGDRVCK